MPRQVKDTLLKETLKQQSLFLPSEISFTLVITKDRRICKFTNENSVIFRTMFADSLETILFLTHEQIQSCACYLPYSN